MHKLKLKPTYKVVKDYYIELDNLMQLSLFTEGAVSPTFAALLRYCAGQFNWTLAEEFTLQPRGGAGRVIRVDGARRRIGLSLRQATDDASADETVDPEDWQDASGDSADSFPPGEDPDAE